MATVYVVQEPAPVRRSTIGTRPPRDLSDARRYGELRFCLEWSETRHLSPEDICERMKTALKDYTPSDYVMLIGHPAAMTFAAMIAAIRGHGMANILTWDRDNHKYVLSRMNVQDLLNTFCSTLTTPGADA